MAYEEKIKNANFFIALTKDTGEDKTLNIEKCLDEGANINKKYCDDFNNTPLHIAVVMKDWNVVNLLLERGANTNCKNKEGKTALDFARELEPNIGKAIIGLLEMHDNNLEKNEDEVNKSININKNILKPTYQKRSCTDGIEGKLYETKLLTLMRIRSFINKYDQFYLGTNLKGVGALDDVCLRYKQNNEDFIVFLQMKHKSEATKIKYNDLWNSTGDFSFFKYFESYKKIRERFSNVNESDVIFNGKYEDTKSYFVIYTSASNELKVKNNIEDSPTDKNVRNLIQTGKYSDKDYKNIFLYQFTEKDIDLLTKSVSVDQIKSLGKNLFNFSKKNKINMMFTDSHIRKYHVILARNVINVSDVNDARHRTGTFRDDFFDNNDEFSVALKETVFKEVIQTISLEKDNLQALVEVVVQKPTVDNISKLMQHVPISYDSKNNILSITNKSLKTCQKKLSEIKIDNNLYKDAQHIAIKDALCKENFCFNLPITFGNTDMVVSGGVPRLDHLASKLEKLLLNSKDKNIIINSESSEPDKLTDAEVTDLDGGLASAVGNLLIPSEEEKYFKFNLDDEFLGETAKILLEKLKKINDLDKFRLKFDIEGLPELSLKKNEHDRTLAKDFLNNLWFYTNQAKEDEVEKECKDTLEDYYTDIKQKTASSIRYEAVYLKMHDEVIKWWMTEGEVDYVTNNKKYFDDVMKEFLEKSLLDVYSSVYMIRIKNLDVEFNEGVVQSLCSQIMSHCTVVVSEVITLTATKLVRYFEKLKNYAFLDLDSPLLLSKNDRNALKEELRNKKLETLIVITNEDISLSKSELFRYMTKELFSKQVIIVTKRKIYEKLFKSIPTHKMLGDERIEVSDLVPECQKKIFNKKIIFQGIEIKLEDIIPKDGKMITPYMLENIINNEIIEVGQAISNSNPEGTGDYIFQ